MAVQRKGLEKRTSGDRIQDWGIGNGVKENGTNLG